MDKKAISRLRSMLAYRETRIACLDDTSTAGKRWNLEEERIALQAAIDMAEAASDA